MTVLFTITINYVIIFVVVYSFYLNVMAFIKLLIIFKLFKAISIHHIIHADYYTNYFFLVIMVTIKVNSSLQINLTYHLTYVLYCLVSSYYLNNILNITLI